MFLWRIAGSLLALVIACALPHFVQTSSVRLIDWAVSALAVISFLSAVETQFSKPLLVDERNRESLPNFITIAWFVTLVSAYLSTAMWNLWIWNPQSGVPLPIAIAVPPSVWVLAGIVSVGLVGTGIIISAKYRRSDAADGNPESRLGYFGVRRRPLFIRNPGTPYNVSDLITYDETGLETTIDLAAVQHLLFQVAAVVIYAVALGRLIFTADPRTAIMEFPIIPEGFLSLLGIAQLAALANRAVPR